MNKKKVTKHTCSKPKADHESPEVFVLPPNLLERLGINLGSIGSASESTTESQVTDLNKISKDKDASENKLTPIKDTNACVTTSSEIESSIIETAKLMKKSVFLSPTFISQNTSVIQGEIEIAGNVEPEALQKEDPVSLMKNEFCDKKSDSNVYKENSSPIALSTQEIKQCDQSVNGNATFHDGDFQTVFDDHADEAYSSDGSNSNIGCAAKTDFNKTHKNKINIISEQIIHPSQFYNLKNSTISQPAENKFIHVPISTMITSHNQNNSYYENIINKNLSPKVTTIINPTEIIVPNECNKPDQNSAMLHTNISTGDISQNIDKIGTCAVLNEISSEFLIVTQNQEELQQDGQILQMFLNKETFVKDEEAVGTDEVVSCHVDTVYGSNIMNCEILEFPTSTGIIYSDHYDDKIKEIKVVDTDSGESKPNSFVTNAESHEIIPEPDNNIAIPCDYEPENKDGNTENSPEDETCNNMKNDLDIEHTHLDDNDFQEVLQNIKEFDTIVEKNGKQLSNVLNSELDLINQKKDSTFTDDQQANQSRTGDLSLTQNVDNSKIGSELLIDIQRDVNINKDQSPHLNQCNDDKNKSENHPEIEASIRSPRLNIKPHNEQEIGKDDINHEHKATREPSEPRVVKISLNENCYENNNVTVDNKLSVIQEDKVREIAHYLSKFADMKKRNNLKERKMACSKTLRNIKHTTNLKSSSQGVEKPGGSNKQIRNGPPANTYGRNRRERRENVPAFVQSMCSDSHTHTQSIDETVSNSLNNVSKEIELCLCDDFGRLTSYDSENVYEHIHFWNNVKSDVTPDMIFSIYDQDISVTIDDYVKSDHYIDEVYPSPQTSTTTDRKLCWHEIELTHENTFDDDYDVDFKKKGNKRIENCIQEEEKHIPRKVNPENVAKNKRKERQVTEKEPMHLNSITANLSQSPKAPPNKIVTDEQHTTSIGKKRKRSIKPVDNDLPPAKKQSQHLLPTEGGKDYSDKDQAAASHVKTRGLGKNPAKSASTALVENTNSVGQTSFFELVSATATGDQSFIPVNIVNDKDCPSTLENEATNNCVDQPSTLSNEDQMMNCSGLNKYASEVFSEGHSIKKEVTNSDSAQCGVCEELVQNRDWGSHIASQHDYLAWKHGEPPLDVNDETAVREHLCEIAKACGGLTCAKCGLTRKYVKAYLSHFRKCNGLNESQNDSTFNISSEIIPKVESESPISKAVIKNHASLAAPDLIKCAICQESLGTKNWIHHIETRHDYLAWKVGDSPLDVNDEVAVKGHLYELTKALGGLRCAKCGLVRKYVKAYLSHIRSCDGLSESQNDSTYDVASEVTPASPATELVGVVNDSTSNINVSNEVVAHTVPVKCGVCEESIQEDDWISHISSQHGYLAWKLGDISLDVNDEVAVREHLNEIAKAYGGLTCFKCGAVRKTVKPYLNHVKRCNGLNESQNDSACDISTNPTIAPVEFSNVPDTNTGDKQEKVALVECGVCHEIVPEETWEDHLGSHAYLAWKHGEPALDVNNEETVKQRLYALTKKYSGLRCVKCGVTRKYVKAYLTHIKDCDGPIVQDTQDASASNVSMDDVSGLDLEPPETALSTASGEDDALRKCAVCGEYVLEKNWHDHRASKHNYLAWVCGEQCLDIIDNAALREHVYTITVGSGLRISESQISEEYVQSYVYHIKFCHGSSVTEVTTTALDADLVKCGVCGQYMENDDWQSHLASNHEYLAWKDGEPPFDVNDKEETREHLQNLAKELGGLNCPKCGLRRKYAKSYLHHVRTCDRNEEDTNDDHDRTESSLVELNHSEIEDTSSYTCGVCNKNMESSLWMKHIFEEHNYLAWKDGETPLDVDDEEQVYAHLYKLSKELGGLTCKHCNRSRKYVKSYLEHVKNCNQEDTNDDPDTTESNVVELNHSEIEDTSSYTCGVCKKDVKESSLWLKHIFEEHNYLAWKDGETPLDVDDEEQVYAHLYKLSKELGGLTCKHCNISRKYVNSYLEHVKNCNQEDTNGDHDTTESSLVELNHSEIEHTSSYTCGVCNTNIESSLWMKHIFEEHNYLAWKYGETALDVDDEEQVYAHLYKLSKELGGLTCKHCNILVSRKYVKPYLEHVKNCKQEDTDHDTELNQSESKDTSRSYKCGACKKTVQGKSLWIKHLSEEHNYLAWKHGETPLDVDDEDQVYQHLYKLSRKLGGLICKYCSSSRKYVKSYLEHVKNCNKKQKDHDETPEPLQNLAEKVRDLSCPKCGLQSKYIKTYLNHLCKCEGDSQEGVIQEREKKANVIICGPCSKVVNQSFWAKHLSENHNYLAWKEGETPLDLNDQEKVNKHLYDLNKEFGGLTCKYCGKTWKYVKTYTEHVKNCGQNSTADESMSEAVDANNSTLDTTIDDTVVVDFASGGVCAVCQTNVEAGKWIQHTQKEHNYLAWRVGETPWNVEDFADINQYLYIICKRMDGLTCRKCGIVRKYVKSYLNHVKTCNVTHFDLDPSVSEGIGPVNKDVYQCAMCKEHIKPAEWKDHAMKKHYNVTWIIGETPIDIKNPYVVEKYLKDYKRVRGTLKCNACGATRVSFSGFYAHIITCGKTEEEIDMFRSVCEICNNPYLCIYKSQHAMIHRVQVYNAELKAKKTEKAEIVEKNEEVSPSGKRRAAVKARSVIEKYSDNMSKLAYTCQSCGYGTDVKEELDVHKCDASNEKDFSGNESSAAEIGSSDESPDSDVDSNISNEVNDDIEAEDDADHPQPKKRIRIRETPSAVSKITRIPFKVEDPNSYIRQGDKDFCNTHLTDEVLYPRWLCKYEVVLDSELARYLPPIEQSCKVKVGTNDWITFNRFEAQRDSTATTLFVGASIVCISWVPLRVEDINGCASNFLAVACHNDVDCPRYQGGETPLHENLIQIWNYTGTQELPKLVFGIAHDFGTVWSMDWCPSGARDTLPEDTQVTCRLGLLAVACSSGSAYIFSVPHPSTVVQNDRLIYKLYPVAELRMTMCTDRKRYQATSVSWSKQKGHMIILVGYADGSTAFYDLHTKSPLLWSMENDIEVFYPYHDERSHNTCITGTDLYPVSGSDATGCGAGAWVAPTGALLATRAGAAGAAGRARLHVASLGVEFAPHAGSAVLAGDDAIMHTAISELVWVPPGRRLGAVRSAAGCARCGRVVAFMPPTLRVMRPHPAYDLKKQVVGMLEMTHLAKKRKKQVNDELAMAIEPLTYADAVSKYGIEFKKINRNDRVLQHQCASKPKAHCPERFPLADVKSMAFCPSARYHDKVAVATHAGILFITNLS